MSLPNQTPNHAHEHDSASSPDALLDTLSTAILLLDQQLRVTYLNHGAEQLLGNSKRHLTGQRLDRLIQMPAELHDRMIESIEREHSFTDRNVVLRFANRESVCVDCAISPWSEESTAPKLLLELKPIDRASRIQRDAALYSQQELVHSLLRGLAHEIKNPLGGLRGAAQLLERELPDPALCEYTEIIIREADRLQGLVDRLFGPTTRPQRTLLNVHEPLEHVRRIVAVAANPDIALQCDYDPSIPDFLCDRDRLVQVFLNIAGNAVEALRRDGAPRDEPSQLLLRSRVATNMTIAGQRHALVAEIAFIDNGPGIDESLRETLFYPLISGRAEGSGLGLSIAQSIMNQLDGLIEYHSEPGQTCFKVYIPMFPHPDEGTH